MGRLLPRYSPPSSLCGCTLFITLTYICSRCTLRTIYCYTTISLTTPAFRAFFPLVASTQAGSIIPQFAQVSASVSVSGRHHLENLSARRRESTEPACSASNNAFQFDEFNFLRFGPRRVQNRSGGIAALDCAFHRFSGTRSRGPFAPRCPIFSLRSFHRAPPFDIPV